MSEPYAIVTRGGDVIAIVPENIVGQEMTSALVPNTGYRMECRPATKEEIFNLAIQLEMNQRNVATCRPRVRYQTVAGVGQALVLVATRLDDPNMPEEPDR